MSGSSFIRTAEDLRPRSARDRLRNAMFADVALTAFRLFLANGFDETTVEEISVTAGISRSTFFRYFATKEDVVVGSLIRFGGEMLTALQAVPDEVDVWTALRTALEPMVTAQEQKEPISGLEAARLVHRNPSLQARHHEKTLSWQASLVPEVARRLRVKDNPIDPRPPTLVAAALGSLSAATIAWVAADGEVPLRDLLDSAMHSLR